VGTRSEFGFILPEKYNPAEMIKVFKTEVCVMEINIQVLGIQG